MAAPGNREHVALAVKVLGPARFALIWDGGPIIEYASEGACATLCPGRNSAFADRDLIRWGAPLSLACQGHVMLHASAAMRDGGFIVVVGKGGAGKTTLARALASRGYEPVSDDALLCDTSGRAHRGAETCLREWCKEVSERARVTGTIPYEELANRLAVLPPDGWAPVRLMLFLSEQRNDARTFLLRRLSGVQAFQTLLEHGLGGLPVPQAWACCFRVYSELVARVPCFACTAPDGLDALQASLGSLDHAFDEAASATGG